MDKDIDKQYEALIKFKNFFESDIKVKEELLKLAPTELDDTDEESRIEYADQLYKALRSLELEMQEMAQNIGIEPTIVKTYFDKINDTFLVGNYKPGIPQQLYLEQFADISQTTLEATKKEFFGHKLLGGNIAKVAGKANSINELLHIFHAYVINSDKILKALPVIETKQNAIAENITLYGYETELSRKLFEEFPLELDCDETDIVSMQNKILMMVRSRGHALTIDIDTSQEDILVKYFIPKLCNREMVEKLPGINKSGISENGATGLFQIPKEEMNEFIFNFIEKVPTDADQPEYKKYIYEEKKEEVPKTTLEKNGQEIAIVQEKNNSKEEAFEQTSKIEAIINKIKEKSSKVKRKLLTLFKSKKLVMLNAPQEQANTNTSDERNQFQMYLRGGQEEPYTIEVDLKSQQQLFIQNKEEQMKGNEAK